MLTSNRSAVQFKSIPHSISYKQREKIRLYVFVFMVKKSTKHVGRYFNSAKCALSSFCIQNRDFYQKFKGGCHTEKWHHIEFVFQHL